MVKNEYEKSKDLKINNKLKIRKNNIVISK